MSSSVDSRIVTMKINNQSFLTGVAATINALANLKNAMNFTAANKGMNDLQNAGSRFRLDGMTSAVEGVSAKFIALSTIAITALSNITNRAINAGTAFAKSFTTAPIMDGLHEYETNLKSIQTIQANTDQPLPKITAALDEMNKFSDQTIYNFSEMAKNVGTFTAAGVKLETAVASIKGIANIAALSGSSSEQAAGAMYQLSQALAAGKVGLMDWNSVVNAGMGGKKLQNALAQTAAAMGVLNKDAIDASGALKINGQSFRESISAETGNGWLNAKVLENTLAVMDGSLSRYRMSVEGLTDKQRQNEVLEKKRQELAKKGVKYTDEQWKSMLKMSDAAFQAATVSKTFSDVMTVAKESVGSGWSRSFQLIIGDMEEAKKLWTGVGDVIRKYIDTVSSARNSMLLFWRENGGRTALIDGLKAAFQGLMSFLIPIKQAFREVFPAKTGQDLLDMTKKFKDFFQNSFGLRNMESIENFRNLFKGIFSIFSIGVSIAKGLFGVLSDVFSAISAGSGSGGGILEFAGNLGLMITNLDQAIKKGGLLTGFFEFLSAVITTPIRLVSKFAEAIGNMFENFSMPDLSGIGDFFRDIGQAIKDFFSGNEEAVGVGLTAAFGTGVFVIVKRFVDGLKDILSGDGMFGSFREALDGLTGSLKAMQTNIQAKTLLTIGGAIALITASVVALSMIDSEKLAKSLGAMSIGFAQLLGAMAILVKISGSAGFVKVPLVAASMVLLSTSVLILTGAIAAMGQLEWSTILKGMTGVAGSILILAGAMKAIPEKRMALTAAGLALLGLALGEIGAAMLIMSRLSWEDLAQGFVGLGGALAAIAGALQFMGPSLVLTGPGLIAVGLALGIIGGAMKVFASMSWEEIGKSMTVLAGSLAILAIALNSMLPALPGAAALLIVSPALLALGATMKILASLSWKQIAKGLTALAGGLIILAAGLTAMIVALPGAAALLVVSPALVLLAGVLKTLGSMKWSQIAKGLAALAGALVIFGIAGFALGPVALTLMAVGAAVALFGAGLALAGVGALGFASAISILAVAGSAGLAMIGAAITLIINLIPQLAIKIAQGLVQFVVEIGKAAGPIVAAFGQIMTKLLDKVVQLIPKMLNTAGKVLNAFLTAIVNWTPKIVSKAVQMLMALLEGIRKNLWRVIQKGTDVVIAFIRGIANAAVRFADAAFKTITEFLNALAAVIRNRDDELGRAGGNLIAAVMEGIYNVIRNAWDEVAAAFGTMLRRAWEEVQDTLGNILAAVTPGLGRQSGKAITDSVTQGVQDSSGAIVQAATVIGESAGSAYSDGFASSAYADLGLITDPVIRPVLDLTDIQSGATAMARTLSGTTVSAGVSYGAASTISSEQQSAQDAIQESTTPTESVIKFEQNNYSPEALSPAEVYRQTRNQLAFAKEALGLS